jgi:hypothetical protein
MGSLQIIKENYYTKFKFFIIIVLVSFNIFYNLLNLMGTNHDTILKWDGVNYNSVINEYINGGYSFNSIKGSEIKDNYLKTQYTDRIAYIWLVSKIFQLTQIDVAYIALGISLFFFIATASILLLILKHVYLFNNIELLISGILFTSFPALNIIFEVGAHPEAPYFFFSCLAMYLYYRNQFVFSAIVIVIAIFFKIAAIVIPVFIIIQLILSNETIKRKNILILLYLFATLYGYFIPKILTTNVQFHTGYSEVITMILTLNHGNLFPYFLNNFQFLTFPFVLYAFKRPFSEKLGLIAIVIIGLIANVYLVVDWWRVWFGLLFIWVIPFSMSYFIEFKKYVGEKVIIVLFLFIIFLVYRSSGTLNFDSIKKVDTYSYISLFFVMMFLEVIKYFKKEKLFIKE